MLRRLVGLAVLLAMGLLRPPAQAEASGLLIADGGFGGTLEIKEQRVRVVINNGVAVTEVDQMFQNRENRVVEALYTFPVPRGASVSDFSMWIGGKQMVGEVVEKKRAREIYESYRQVRRDPGLLEQVDYRRFEMRIFPIAAGAEQRVRLVYYQELDFDHDVASYVYPLATTTRGGVVGEGRPLLVQPRRAERGADRRDVEPLAQGAVRHGPARRALPPGQLRGDCGRPQPRRGRRLPHRAPAHRPRPRRLAHGLRGRLLAADAHGRQGAREAGGRGHGLRLRARRLRLDGQRRQASAGCGLAGRLRGGARDGGPLRADGVQHRARRALPVAGGGGPRHARGGARVPRLAAGPRRHRAAAGPGGRLPLPRPGPHAQRGRALGRDHRAERAPRAARRSSRAGRAGRASSASASATT